MKLLVSTIFISLFTFNKVLSDSEGNRLNGQVPEGAYDKHNLTDYMNFFRTFVAFMPNNICIFLIPTFFAVLAIFNF